MDFITQLPPTKMGHDAILVFVDRFTKMVHFAPTNTDVSAIETARLFTEHVFRLHGQPKSIVSDRDTRFTSTFWRSLMENLGTQLKAFHGVSPADKRSNRESEPYTGGNASHDHQSCSR